MSALDKLDKVLEEHTAHGANGVPGVVLSVINKQGTPSNLCFIFKQLTVLTSQQVTHSSPEAQAMSLTSPMPNP